MMANGAKLKSSFVRPRAFLRSLCPRKAGTSQRATSGVHLSRAANPLLAIFLACPFAYAQNPPPILAPATPPPPPPPPKAAGQQAPSNRLRSESDLVVLHVTVADDRGAFVPELKEGNFRIFEQNIEQKISVFSRGRYPVTMGLVIDNSGSMREKREQVNAAAMTFVQHQ